MSVRHSRRWGPRHRRGEEGSALIVVVILMVVIVLFGTAFVARATGDLHNSTYVNNINAARAQALAGLSDALFRLDQQGTTNASFCVGNEPWCTVSPSVQDAPDDQYAAKLVNGSFTVESEATVHGRSYAVQASVVPVTIPDFGIFAGSNATFDGSASNVTIEKTASSGAQTGLADVGSDGTVVCNGSGTYGQNQVTYDGGSSNCPGWENETNTYDPQQPVKGCPAPPVMNPPPIPCMGSTYLACPAGNTFTGTVSGGVYYCKGSVTFSGTVNLDSSDDPVKIFLFPDSNGQSNINMAGAVVNQYDNTPDSPGCDGNTTVLYDCGNPVDMQVYAAGSGTVNVGNGSSGATFDGILYAPGLNLTANSGQVLWTGSLTVNQIVINGNPNFSLHYDVRMATVAQPTWQIQNFTSIAPQSFSLSLT